MARFPGTERHVNRDGWTPGARVRCRRSSANAAAGLADREGVVAEVRASHVRVVLDARGASVWIPGEQLAAGPDALDAPLERLTRSLHALRGERLEVEEPGRLIIYGPEYAISALDEVRALFGAELAALEIHPAGVHELATHLQLREAPTEGS